MGLKFLLPICSEYLSCIELWYMLIHLPESNADLKVIKQCYLFTFIRLFVFVILVLDDPQHVWELWGHSGWFYSGIAGRKTHYFLLNMQLIRINSPLSEDSFLWQEKEHENVWFWYFHFAGGQGQATLKWIPNQTPSETFSDSYPEAQI